jgi:hypothetical protein
MPQQCQNQQEKPFFHLKLLWNGAGLFG